MIINNQEDLTKAVLAEIARAPDPRFREIMSAFVRHLHDFAREVRLTEEEFQKAVGYIVRLGQKTTDSHNEAVLMSGSLGFSTLICLLNNGNRGATETTANLLGPFWRPEAPRMPNGATLVRSPTPGVATFVKAWVKDNKGNPIEGADVDIWHSSTEGYYENQDPVQADMNLRGIFTTDQDGHIHFRTIKPSGYPIPVDGPTGDLLRAQGRANFRPAHLHFLIHKPGFKTHISQVYSDDDPHLETDSQFGARAGREGAVVFARVHLRDRAGDRQDAAAADHREDEGRAAADRKVEAGVVAPSLRAARSAAKQSREAYACGSRLRRRPRLLATTSDAWVGWVKRRRTRQRLKDSKCDSGSRSGRWTASSRMSVTRRPTRFTSRKAARKALA
jgi:hydroxyquinol 1,2-dioxygenase